MRKAILCVALLTLAGCGFLDSVFRGESNAAGEIVKRPLIEHITGPVGAIPGYGGLAAAGLGLLAALYKSIRARQEEGKKIGIMSGIEIAKENWDQVKTFADLVQMLKTAPDSKTQRAIDADLDALRAKGVI